MADHSARGGASGSRAASASIGRAGGEAVAPVRKSPRAVGVFLLVALAGTAADLLSKHLAFAALMDAPRHSIEVVPGLLRFTLSTNAGIALGIRVPPVLVALASAAAVAAVLVLFATSSRRHWGLHLALGMVMGGALGNAYDRLFSVVRFPGEAEARTRQVRDFIDVYPIRYPVFNVADALLVVGVALILLHMLRHPSRPTKGR